MNNEADYHLAAILWRRNKLITIGVNSTKHSNRFIRYFNKNGNIEHAFCNHAEMLALINAREGDLLEVLRWRANGTLAMAKPCSYCQKRIEQIGVRVRYTNDEGKWERLDV